MGLLCNGANVNIPDLEGNTPLHLAVKSNLVPVIHALIAFEADIDYMYVNLKFLYLHTLKVPSPDGSYARVPYFLRLN